MRRDRTPGADDSRAGLCDNAAMDSAPMVTVRKFNTEVPVVAADHYHIRRWSGSIWTRCSA